MDCCLSGDCLKAAARHCRQEVDTGYYLPKPLLYGVPPQTLVLRAHASPLRGIE